MTKEQAGAYVRSVRQTRKLGVGDVTGAGELARQTWYDLENGVHPPTEATQRKVAEALDLPLDWYDRLKAGEAADVAPVAPTGTVAKRLVDLERETAALRSVAAMIASIESSRCRPCTGSGCIAVTALPCS